ncbi:STAS domain-containing protein [Kibdelosporangium lantanae]|uniref:Anti-sigma factor antagonist n=1 Tax=Kibdelosporangium lantanae TaxID=1497396 RepID=A0ABW3M8U3_9PSEU
MTKTQREPVLVLHVRGEIDIDTAPAVADEAANLHTSAPTLVLDLSGVTFCGAVGLRTLLDIQHRTQLAGTTLLLVAPPPIVRLLTLTDLAHVFQTHYTLDQALAAAGGPPEQPGHLHSVPAPRSDVDTPAVGKV